jgi:CheY-like chemotaxis protein
MSGRSALIIEDDSDLAIIFSQALQAAGFATGIIQDGDQALARLAITTPDVVVLDLHMPRVSGAEILRRIRADARLAGTRVIIATADIRATDMLQDQADLVLIKPVSFAQLRDLAGRLASPPKTLRVFRDP